MNETPATRSLRQRLAEAAFAPVDIAHLVWFRVAFGLLMVREAWCYLSTGRVGGYDLDPVSPFKYFGFSWVQPWPGWGMHLHFILAGLAGFGVALGWRYRCSAIVLFLAFAYVFLLDQARYLNHHYLVCLFAFLLIFVPAHRACSLDARRRPDLRSGEAPAWSLWLLQAQIVIVYFFAGVAKINPDWLAGEPMRVWLLRRSDYALVGQWFAEPWPPFLFSYAGLLFDLLVGPMLLWRRTRWLAFLSATAFNLTNCWLFTIGIFPWLALAATILLFQPRLPRPFPTLWRPLDRPVANGVLDRGRRRMVLVLVTCYVAFQILFPLRHWLYPGDAAWTDEGHRFSWRMMLRSKSGNLSLLVHDPASGESWTVSPLQYLTDVQYRKAAARPDMILQLCHHVVADLEAYGYRNLEIYAIGAVSLNGRPRRPLVDPEVDLAKEPRTLLPASWIAPFPGGPPGRQPASVPTQGEEGEVESGGVTAHRPPWLVHADGQHSCGRARIALH